MFSDLASLLKAKFSKKDDLSKQVEIVKVFDLIKLELTNLKFEDAELVSLKDKTLTVRVENSVAANELRLREYGIIQNVNASLGKEVLRRVIYRF